MAPVLLNNKVLKPFFQFQLEVENQMHHFRDIKRTGTAEAYDLLTNPQMAGKRARQGITEDMVKQMLGDEPLSLEATKLQRKIMASGNAKKWIRMLMYLVFLSLWGEFTRATMGRDQTWNPYGMLAILSGVVDGDTPVEFQPAVGLTTAQIQALQAANVQEYSQSAGTIVFKAHGTVPTIDIPIRINVRGDVY